MLWSISLSLSLSLSSIVIRIVCDWGLNREMLIRGYQTVGTGTLLQGRIYERLPPKMVKMVKQKMVKESRTKNAVLSLSDSSRIALTFSRPFAAKCMSMFALLVFRVRHCRPDQPPAERVPQGREGNLARRKGKAAEQSEQR